MSHLGNQPRILIKGIGGDDDGIVHGIQCRCILFICHEGAGNDGIGRVIRFVRLCHTKARHIIEDDLIAIRRFKDHLA